MHGMRVVYHTMNEFLASHNDSNISIHQIVRGPPGASHAHFAHAVIRLCLHLMRTFLSPRAWHQQDLLTDLSLDRTYHLTQVAV